MAGMAAGQESALDDEGEDEEVQLRRRHRRRRGAILSLGLSTCYYGVAMLYYTQRAWKKCRDPPELENGSCTSSCWEKWNAGDAVYFATVTMTTVGYGDLKPSNPENMALTVLFILFGVIFVFPSIAQALAPFYQGLELIFFRLSDGLMRLCLGKKADGALVDLDGDGIADYEDPPPAALYYLKGISSWLIMWLLSQIVFAALYQLIEPETFTFGSAFYLCLVTATTVGYGDVGVRDEASHRMFASVHILYSVSSLAALLNTVQVLHSERTIQIRKATLLQRQLDPDLIQSLDKDNNGLDKLEFVVGMLTKLEILHWDDVEPFLAQFDALDVDKSGRLDKTDLLRLVEMNEKKVEAKRKADARAAADKARKKTGAIAPADEEAPAAADDSSGHSRMGAPQGTSTQVTEMAAAEWHDGLGGGKQVEGDLSIEAAGSGAGGVPPASPSPVYGGRAARNREMAAAGSPVDGHGVEGGVEAAIMRQKRRLPFVGSGLPMQVLAGVRRPRRPRHLRGKINPGS